MSRYALLATATLLTAAIAGCDHDNRQRYTYGDCNGGGCFGCTDATQQSCWPLPYSPCKAQSDCKAEEICTTLGCAAHCAADADCRDGEVCTGAGYCAPGSAKSNPVGGASGGTGAGSGSGGAGANQSEPGVLPCALDSQCFPGETCVAGKCTHSASCGIPASLCATDRECGDLRTCFLGTCHVACGVGGPCPLGQMCSSGACVDSRNNAECVFDYQCGAAYRCINAACHPLCANDAHCTKGEACDSGVCRADIRPALARPAP